MSGRGQRGAGTYIQGFPVVSQLPGVSKYAVNLQSWEMLTQSLYDSAAYPTTGVASLTFFQFQTGTGTGVISGASKTLEDTNMQNGGSLPAMQAYIVSSIEVEVQTGISSAGFAAAELPSVFGAQLAANQINDMYKIRMTGYLNFNIGSKSYMQEGPLGRFAPATTFQLNAGLSDTTTAAAASQSRIAYADMEGPVYNLSPNNLLLVPQQNFNVTLNWNTLETVTAAARIFVRLGGQLLRAAQ